ncbi:hypothetical protein [Ramlibacter alkalitolerans]|jgi:hypothetical protein|uniref:PXPV repeat-containing protein n=1 Tax=Ramlibacter alkalitolerans TaxID=2039631 RepID=A0ABS1JQJ6_9BURK|nr:hypothetical protein [Ramlibacter alkalitolerans]MBL0426508.1 hypothetical protein [Ramlibacter alkalitolerans]
MKRLISAKSLLATTLAIGALAAGTAAHARTDVFLSLGLPGAYVQPAPVYVQPQPVYVQPQPVYVQPEPVYVQPRPVYVQPQPVFLEGHRHHRQHHNGAWGDADRDGVPNRYDRAPNNPYRR